MAETNIKMLSILRHYFKLHDNITKVTRKTLKCSIVDKISNHISHKCSKLSKGRDSKSVMSSVVDLKH